jgi:nitroreductase
MDTPLFQKPVAEVIRERFSCRKYRPQAIPGEALAQLQDHCARMTHGPLGMPLRFQVAAASDQDQSALRGLGTYGMIKNPAGFLVGTICPQGMFQEEFGYAMETLILHATDLGLGSCWLGGAFTRSSFARKINAAPDEHIPAVAALGLIADEARARQSLIRRQVHADQRLPWEQLFFDGAFTHPLSPQAAGDFALPLEMVRLSPSAHNKQTWRVVRDASAACPTWHFYRQRAVDRIIQFSNVLFHVDDLQRIESGIAMAHFDLTARALGLHGHWVQQEPPIARPNAQAEYAITWVKDPCAA